MIRTKINIMARKMANLTHKRGIIRDAREWGVRISTVVSSL